MFSPPTTAPAVHIQALDVVRGGRTVLHELDLSIPRGSVTGLLGPSGCGKSTLLRAIVGVQKVAGGTVTVLGEEAGSAGLRRRVAYVTQSASVYRDLTVRQNLWYFAAILGESPAAVASAMDQVALSEFGDARLDRLSGGQLNRVSLAAALLGTPELLVLDEPTVGLDPVLRRDLWDIFLDLAARGTTLLVSSHVMDEAERCQRLLLMREGRILANEPPEELKSRMGAADVESAFLRLVECAGAMS
jgi:ABC-2 type transport system ATP-binding protein